MNCWRSPVTCSSRIHFCNRVIAVRPLWKLLLSFRSTLGQFLLASICISSLYAFCTDFVQYFCFVDHSVTVKNQFNQITEKLRLALPIFGNEKSEGQ